MIGTEWLEHMDCDAKSAVAIIESQAIECLDGNSGSPLQRETAIQFLLHLLALHGHIELVDAFLELEEK